MAAIEQAPVAHRLPAVCCNDFKSTSMGGKGIFDMAESTSARFSASVAIIHNQDEKRLGHVRPACRMLAERWGADVYEVFEQPPIVVHSRLFALWRAICYRRADAIWRRHRMLLGIPLRERWLSLKSLARRHLLSPLACKAARAGAIEMVVTAKHLKAWRVFVEQGSDFLLVLEDDAVFKPDSFRLLERAREHIETSGAGGDFYMDLAGGLDINVLEVSAIMQLRTNGFIEFARPVTNTACAYVLNAATAAAFLRIIDRRPWFRYLAIDWLINMLMVTRLNDSGRKFVCLHAFPPVLAHGSTTGAYVAWQR